MCEGSKNRVGPLFKMDRDHVTMVLDIRYCIRSKSEKIDFVKFQKILLYKGRIELEKLSKSVVKTRDLKCIAIEIYHYKILAIRGLCHKNRPFKNVTHSFSVQNFLLNFCVGKLVLRINRYSYEKKYSVLYMNF